MSRLNPGDHAPHRVVVDLGQTPRRIPSGRLLHLQLRRFAGCPICNLHMADYAHRIDEITAAGVDELAVFMATRQGMLPYQGHLPFPTAPDPDFSVHAAFGGERSLGATLARTRWGRTLGGVVAGAAMGKPERLDAAAILPADFLIGSDGIVIDCHYGRSADDSWTVDELLARVPAATSG